MSTKTRFTPEEEKSIVSDYLNGMPIQEIYRKWEIGNTILAKIRKRNGVKPRGCNYTEFQRKVLEYRKQGLCSSEIAELTGKDTKSVKQASEAVGSPFTDEEKQKAIELSHFKRRRTEDYIKEACSSIGFEYVGGYMGSNGFVDLRCPECGTVIERTWDTIRKMLRGYQKTIICPICAENRKTEEEQKKILARTIQEKERNQRFWRQDFEQKTFSFCSRCGGIYIAKKNKKYCSEACAKAIQNSRAKDKRLAKIKNVHKDNIDLKRLYVRDGGVCWLCKTTCDWNDYRRTETAFIAGENYPSIDHVIPLAKGGSHSWDNVRLAHRGCNTKKSDRVVEGMPPYGRFCG